jgi:hypothetical protein
MDANVLETIIPRRRERMSQLPQWSRVLLNKQTVTLLVKTSPTFYRKLKPNKSLLLVYTHILSQLSIITTLLNSNPSSYYPFMPLSQLISSLQGS